MQRFATARFAIPNRFVPATWFVLLLLLVGLTNAEADSNGDAETEGSHLGGPTLTYPVLFVTQVPIPNDFATVGSVFANHSGEVARSGRGGDLWIRYPNGSPLLRNLTEEAGYGEPAVFQGADSIAVRDPAVHWDGTKAVFSMVVGSGELRYEWGEFYWQLYEVTGLGQGDTPVITKVPKQPEDFNNVSPTYGTDGRILFVSDRPRNGARHLYPQHDEYESTETPTGLWSLDPSSASPDGDLFLLQHSPSGSFDPMVDTYGRVLFTRWDHLQRDQQADADHTSTSGTVYGTFDFADESAGAARIPAAEEVFPEPRPSRTDLLEGTNLEGHTLNHFFPWQVEEDGTREEVLNHLGRHELHSYFNRSMNDDSNLVEFIDSVSGRFNPNSILNVLQLTEDPNTPGKYFAVDAPEFQTHASGRVISILAPETTSADQIAVTYETHPVTDTVIPDGDPVPAEHSGHYRDPLVLANGIVVAAHTTEAREAANEGDRNHPVARYDFRLRQLTTSGGYLEPASGGELTGGIVETVSFWDPDELVTYTDVELWELQPVEVRSRSLPPTRSFPLDPPELQMFTEAGVNPAAFQQWLVDRDLALMVVRDATARDEADRQQPFNLAVPGGVQTIGAPGTIYSIEHLQYFQGDQLRGIGGISDPAPGRRVIAQVMHDPAVQNPPNPGGPAASVSIALDGSTAATVPARRAMVWQTTDGAGTPVVRERNWITFQPGEIRVCDGCHGVNSANQEGQPASVNPPEALRTFLIDWAAGQTIFADGFESGDTTAW